MKKFRVNYKTAGILGWVFTVIYLVFAFWVDWRVGCAFLAYDLSCVFDDIRDDIKRDKKAAYILSKLKRRASKDAERKTDD